MRVKRPQLKKSGLFKGKKTDNTCEFGEIMRRISFTFENSYSKICSSSTHILRQARLGVYQSYWLGNDRPKNS